MGFPGQSWEPVFGYGDHSPPKDYDCIEAKVDNDIRIQNKDKPKQDLDDWTGFEFWGSVGYGEGRDLWINHKTGEERYR